MSIKGGPKIETSGLQLYYDVDNIDSYPGEPTTNLLDSDMTGGSMGNDATNTIEAGFEDPFGGNSAFKFTCTDGDGTSEYPHIRQYPAITGTTATHTFSVGLKWLSGTTTLSLYSFRGSPGAGAAGSNITITSEWVKYTMTFNPLDTSAHTIDIIQNLADASAQSYLIAFPQCEEKDHATQYVDGTRSTTDGLKDLSGNANHADLANATYDSNALIDYDGVSGVTDCGSAIITGNNPGSWTIGFYPVATGTPLFLGTNTTSEAMVSYGQTSDSNRIRVGFGGGDKLTATIACPPSTGSCVTYTGDGTTLRAYVNAVACGTATGFVFNISSTSTFLGGTNISSQLFTGKVDVARIYNQALTATEQLNNYNAVKSRFGH